MKEEYLSASNVALAFVGSLLPDESSFHTIAFSRAGNMYQEDLLVGLSNGGLSADFILSQHPMPGFPRGKFWFRGKTVSTQSGLKLKLVSFINLLPFRVLTVGSSVLVNLLWWGWRNRERRRVVYSFNLTEPPGLFTLVAARLIRAKALANVNDINVPGNTVPNTWARRVDFWIQQRLVSHLDGLVVVSDSIVRDFAPEATFIRVEGGVKESLLSQFHRSQKLRAEHHRQFTIVSAGSLDEANGVIELLEAFALLQDSRFRLMIAGAGPLEGLVREAAERDPHIEYCGFLSFDEVTRLYTIADVLVNMRLTQRLNTQYFFPSKMMEYLASGVPVITTATGHVGAEYKDFVFLLLDETAESLAEMIRYVAAIDPETRHDLGKRAQEFVRYNLTWEAQGRRLVQFIQEQL